MEIQRAPFDEHLPSASNSCGSPNHRSSPRRGCVMSSIYARVAYAWTYVTNSIHTLRSVPSLGKKEGRDSYKKRGTRRRTTFWTRYQPSEPEGGHDRPFFHVAVGGSVSYSSARVERPGRGTTHKVKNINRWHRKAQGDEGDAKRTQHVGRGDYRVDRGQ